MKNKKHRFSDNDLNRGIKILGIILLTLLIILVAAQFSSVWRTILNAFRTVFIPLILSFIIAYILNPIVVKFESLGLRPRFFAVVIVYITIGTILIFSIINLYPILSNEVQSLFDNEIQDVITYLETDLRDDFIFGQDAYDYVYNFITQGDEFANSVQNLTVQYLGDLPTKIAKMVAVIIIVPIILAYYLKDYDTINRSILKFVPTKNKRDARVLISRLNNTIGFYIRGQLLLMLAIGIMATILYKVIGFDLAILFGLLIGVTNIIPYFGAFIGALPAIIYALYDPNVSVWLTAGGNLLLQQIEGNFLQPIIMGKQLALHPLIIITSILFFGSLLGPIGVVVATPLAGSIKVFIEFYIEKRDEAETELEANG